MEIVKVEWKDARSIDGWCEERDFEENLSLIHSAGYLVKENAEAIFVSACAAIDLEDGNSYACTIVIPKQMIVSIETISK
jgi:hypothetical protein